MKPIALIGMPGAGKSTIGKALAARRGSLFIDTDKLIEQQNGAGLQQLLEQQGYRALREMEARAILGLNSVGLNSAGDSGAVIATGGSAVYSAEAMQSLRSQALLVYLSISLATMRDRVRAADENQRGLARPEQQSLEQLYAEREGLYRAAADRIIVCDGRSVDTLLSELENTATTARR